MSILETLPPAPEDDLPCRPAGVYAVDKLGVLNAYLWAFSQACNGAKRNYRPYPWWYVDAMAGPGVNELPTGTRIPGSPLIASSVGNTPRHPPAEGLVFSEGDPKLADALATRTAADKRTVVEQCDVNEDPQRVLRHVPGDSPTMAFFDPEGFDVGWDTLGEFSRWKRPNRKKIELLVMLPTNVGMLRTLFLERDQPDWSEERWDFVFGPLNWREIYEARRRGDLDPSDSAPALVDLYRSGLEEGLGYAYTHRRRVPAQGRPRYWLIFATDHEGGDRIMDWVMDQVYLPEGPGQLALFDFGPNPEEFR